MTKRAEGWYWIEVSAWSGIRTIGYYDPEEDGWHTVIIPDGFADDEGIKVISERIEEPRE